MPPQALQAGPRSRPTSFAGITGGESVSASAAATVLAGCDAFGFSGALPPPVPTALPPPPFPPPVGAPFPAAVLLGGRLGGRHGPRRVAAHQCVLRRLPGADLGRHDP